MLTGWLGIALPFLFFFFAAEKPLIVAHVRSGHAQLRQVGRLTVLELTAVGKPMRRAALTHPSDYSYGISAPYEAIVIAESPQHFLIFTDTLESNPGNVQGMCGASDQGERFVHVVSLEGIPHETLSVPVESCLMLIEPGERSPEWRAEPTTSGHGGELILRYEDEPPTRYYVSSDGSVGRARVGEAP